MKRLVNGDLIDMTPDEEAAFLASVPGVSVPSSVTMRQGRLALLAAGKLGLIAPAIAALTSPQKEAAEIEWEYSSAIQRHGALVTSLAAAIGLSGAELDALFIAAAGL